MDKHRNFAKNLAAIRNAREESLAEFSKELGVPKSTLQAILNEGNTTLYTALHISERLNISLDELANDTTLSQRFDVFHNILRSLHWFSSLSQTQQEAVKYHLYQILEVMNQCT
ncbi:MAG: helix-turn-helix transcriptional regulator [Oscillospiraceae bacterium]|nr:helix-turn-helix transcriptional regulator [Oscillospiraceae bacterium]